MKRFDVVILTIAVAVLAGGGGFALGHFTAGTAATAQTASGQNGSGFGGGSGRGGQGPGGMGRGAFGTVASISGDTLTVTTRQGSTRSVTLTSTTTYDKGDGSAATQADLVAGASVIATGDTATDGTITATKVTIDPQMPSGGPGGAPSAGTPVQ